METDELLSRSKHITYDLSETFNNTSLMDIIDSLGIGLYMFYKEITKNTDKVDWSDINEFVYHAVIEIHDNITKATNEGETQESIPGSETEMVG